MAGRGALVPVLYAALRALHLLRSYRLGWLRSVRVAVPVIVVGNLTVGGSGKTPLVIALVEALRARGLRPGVVSRGYGGSAARPPLLLDDVPDPRAVGDEPLPDPPAQRRAGRGRARSRARPRAAAASAASTCVDRRRRPAASALARDIEICVIDGQRRFGNGRLLPAGPLRARTAGAAR